MTCTEYTTQIIWHERVDSTLEVLAEHLQDHPDAPCGTTIVADHQDAGRGRSGRQWNTLPGQSLLMATLVEVPNPTLAWVTALAGLATLRAAQTFAPETSLKWPNDVLLEGKKIAGILCEHLGVRREKHLVAVGIGVNLGDIPTEAGPAAAALPIRTTPTQARDQLLESILAHLGSLVTPEEADHARWRSDYEAALAHLDAPTSVRLPNGSTVCGHTDGVNLDASLRLRTTGGTIHTIRVGDVELPDTPTHLPFADQPAHGDIAPGTQRDTDHPTLATEGH